MWWCYLLMRRNTTKPSDLSFSQKPASIEVRWGVGIRRRPVDEGIYHIAIHCYHKNYFQKSECPRDREQILGEQCNSPIKNTINSYEVSMYTVCNQMPPYDWVWKSRQVRWIPLTLYVRGCVPQPLSSFLGIRMKVGMFSNSLISI